MFTHIDTHTHRNIYTNIHIHAHIHRHTHSTHIYTLTWAQVTYDKQDNCLLASLGYDGLYPEKPIIKVQTSKQKMCLLHLIESTSQLGSRVHWRASGFHGDHEDDWELLPGSTRGSHTSYHNVRKRSAFVDSTQCTWLFHQCKLKYKFESFIELLITS